MKKQLKRLSDEALVKLVRDQNQELYAEIIRRYQAKLLRYADYLIQDENKAEDAVQQALIKAFINLRGFDTKKKFSSWLYRIVHNEAINQAKKNQKEISLDGHQKLKQMKDNNFDLIVALEKKEKRQQIYACLNQLPLKYRSPLVLFYLDNKSYEEISDVLRLPLGTVGTRINRAKKLMAQLWSAKGGEKHQ